MFEGEGKIRPIDFVSSTEVNTARSKLRNLSDWSGEFSIYKVIESTYGGHIDAIHTHKLSPNLTPAPQRLVRRERERRRRSFVCWSGERDTRGKFTRVCSESVQASFRPLQTASDGFRPLHPSGGGSKWGRGIPLQRKANEPLA